jgi:peptidoglycan/xylan/chitin deacetylase (PgdA/CDA1 family)
VRSHATKQRIKNAVYRGVGAVGVRVGAGRGRDGLRVLLYHKVNDLPDNPGSVPTAVFADHMAALDGMGFRVVGRDDVTAHVKRGAALPPGAILLTFDDGYRDTLDNAAPVLARLGYPGVVFVSVGHVETGAPMPHEMQVAAPNPLLDWAGLEAIERLGIDVESHGIDHIPLASLPMDEARRQIVESRRILQERLGRPVTAYAFVKGSRVHQGPEHVAILDAAGYELGFTTITGSNTAATDALQLRRYNVEPYPTATLELVLRGACDALAVKDSRIGTAARRVFNSALRTASE